MRWQGADLAANRATIDRIIEKTPVFHVGSFPRDEKLAAKVRAGKGLPKTLKIIDNKVENTKDAAVKRDYFVLRAMIARFKRDDLMLRAKHMQVNEPKQLRKYINGLRRMYAGTSFEKDIEAREKYLERNILEKSTRYHNELVRTMAPVRKAAPCDACAGVGLAKARIHCLACRAKHPAVFTKARDRLEKIYRKHDFELRKAYADQGVVKKVIPESEHPYPILIVMAEHIVLMGGAK